MRASARSAALVALFACLGATPARADGPTPPPADLKERVDAYLKPLVESGLFSGAALVARGGEVLVEAGWGVAEPETRTPIRPDTRFKLMSVTKCLTAVAAMRLVQEGRLRLDAPVAEHLDPWPAAWREVKVHDLLDHTSGIPNLEGRWALFRDEAPGRDEVGTWREFAPRVSDEVLASPAGARHAYSNFNYVVLGALIEAASGRPYAEALRGLVLGPAGMSSTGTDDGVPHPGLAVGHQRGPDGSALVARQDMSRILGAGGAVSTVGDLHRLDRALRGDAILTAATRARMHEARPATQGYACGWTNSPVLDRPCLHHSGGANGYVAQWLRFPDDDACVVVLSNFSFAPVERIATDLAALLFGKPVAARAAVSPASLLAAAGVYVSAAPDTATLVLEPSGRTFVLFAVRAGDDRPRSQLLVPLEGERFLLPRGEKTLRVLPGGADRQARVELDGVEYERTAAPAAAWAEAAGPWQLQPPASGVATLTESLAGLSFQDPSRGSGAWKVLPVGADLAIALVAPEGGPLLRLERDASGVASRLSWLRPGEREEVHAVPAAATEDVELPAAAAPFEVVVIGTIHAPWQFRSRRFTPAHVRAALEAAMPAVVGVESPPEWLAKGRFHAVTYEAQGIAVPFARSRGLPVVGVDWQDPDRERSDLDRERETHDRLAENLATTGVLLRPEFGEVPASALPAAAAAFANDSFDFERIHAPRGEVGGPAPARISSRYGGARNRRIAAQCVRAMEGRAGKRLVVVIGAAHKPVLETLLASVEGVRVLRWGKDVALPTPEAVERAWTREDLLAVLGHGLDGERSYFHPTFLDLPRLKEVLARLEALPDAADLAAYYRARWLAACARAARGGGAPAPEGDPWAEAAALLDRAAASRSKESPYPFPMDHWRMRYGLAQAARLERAAIDLERGGSRAARPVLEALVRERRATERPTTVREDALRDPGFEEATTAGSPSRGWWCSEAGPRARVSAVGDESVRTEGRRSLRLEVTSARAEPGWFWVSQNFALPAAMRGKEWKFQLQMRGERVRDVSLVACRVDAGGARSTELARDAVSPNGTGWKRASVSIPVSAQGERFALYVYFAGPPGARLWLDAGTPLEVRVTRIPVADLLAREYPRTLLDAAPR